MQSSIQHGEGEQGGAFFIEDGGRRLAEMTYTRSEDGRTATLLHTGVSETLRGQGVARQLVEAAVKWARREQLTLVPVCTFARAVFEREPSLQDVLRAPR